MLEYLTGLEEGRYTQQTGLIKDIAAGLAHDAIQKKMTVRKAISLFVRSIPCTEEHKDALYRWRDASTVIEDAFVTGCTDRAIVFLALARASGLACRYVETFETTWLADAHSKGISGHVFIDILHEHNWHPYEPLFGFTPNGVYELPERMYTVVGKGVDFGALYLHDGTAFRTEPESLKYFNEALLLHNKPLDTIPRYCKAPGT